MFGGPSALDLAFRVTQHRVPKLKVCLSRRDVVAHSILRVHEHCFRAMESFPITQDDNFTSTIDVYLEVGFPRHHLTLNGYGLPLIHPKVGHATRNKLLGE